MKIFLRKNEGLIAGMIRLVGTDNKFYYKYYFFSLKLTRGDFLNMGSNIYEFLTDT